MDFDVIVIGAGSAGTSAARAARQAGARTALVNDGELGGLCILRGCMPTKAMLASAHAAAEPRHAERFGVRIEGPIVADFSSIMRRKDALVARFQRAKVASIDRLDCELIDGRARFTTDGRLEVGGRSLSARSYVIATGSVPSIPRLATDAGVPILTSDDVMRLEQPPRSLIVWGAGAVGLELGQFFAQIGTEVTIVNRSPLLHRFDVECGRELARALAAEPRLSVLAPVRIEAVARCREGVEMSVVADGVTRSLRAEALLVATGRRPAIADLGLEHVGVDVDAGHILHDATMRSTNPSIFVAGDATGRFQVLHLANQAGLVAGHNAAGVKPERVIDYRLKMSVVFTDPAFAAVGMTVPEAERACAGGRPVVSAAVRFPETGRAITMGVEHGLWKLLADRETSEILGSTILGPRADDLVHVVSTLLFFRARIHDIPHMPWYHPTLAEVMLNLERGLAECIAGVEKAPPPPA